MKNIYTTLYVVRHGQSEWNEKGLVQGQTESPLTTLGERQFGDYEGKPWEALRLLDEMQLTVEEDKKFSFKPHPDIESDEELVSRFITFLREVSVSYPGKTLLVVTHGGIIRALLLHLGL